MAVDEDGVSIAALIDELKNDDVQVRLNSVRRLSTIARALGAERTRNELIPFLQDSTDDEDEVLLALAEELGKLIDGVGGVEFSHHLLPPLEIICSAEETVVRDKSAESLNTISERMPLDLLVDHFVAMLKRLASSEWFSCRISSCSLFPTVYSRVPPAVRPELRGHYAMLCRDDTAMVRRAASATLGKFARVVEREFIRSEIVPIFSSLAQDDQDSVRLLCVENCVALARFLQSDENLTFVLPVIRAATQDKSWRVRYMVAEHFTELSSAVGPEITRTELIAAFVVLLKDAEAEVRTAAASKVTTFSQNIALDAVLKHIVPCVRDLVVDPSQHVRAMLASNIMGLAAVIGKQHTIDYLVPLLLQLLRDEDSQVRLNIIKNLESVSKVIGTELLSRNLLPAIVELAEDKQWRVRLAIIEHIPQLAAQLGVQFFDEKLSALCMTWLGDQVFTIRDAATNNLRKLTEVFGNSWCQGHILPRIDDLKTHPNYLHRLTSLFAAGVLTPVLPQEVVQSTLLPLILRLANDPVPNIRFNVAKTLKVVIARVDALITARQIKPVLQTMSGDSDRDVSYYAVQALQMC
eukprot:TRINITY_DN7702_c0_g1_i1.p1 TRINITY_DN7702_c0_g1~~TRINITY_DN7702_c0_g1_i1.p1  ORF type:complete len:580 (+),score=173.37 TRINITY_DN7702_c0_g1_i1:126-1865(+)